MMTKIKQLLIKYRELIVYAVFGVLTTVVNLIVFALFGKLLGNEKYLISNIIAWFAAVSFSYITNKIWVFESKSWRAGVLLKEIPSFFAARVLTLGIEEAGLYFLIDVLSFGDISLRILTFDINGELISKAVVAVLVVIVNYIFSKLVIFKKNEQ